MHVRNLVLFTFLLVGCGEAHFTMTSPDSGMPVAMGDAGPAMMAAPDTGTRYYEWPDAGPAAPDAFVDNDAGSDPIVRVVFDGPAESDVLRGTQDAVMYAFSVSSSEEIELRFLDFAIEGVTSSDRVVGSAGTELFRDIKLKDLDTGATLMGPVTLATSRFTDSFIIHAGETRRFAITMDISNHEDVAGEFFDGTHRYRVTVGDTRFGGFFETAAIREVATGVFLGPEVIENDVIISGNVRTIVDADVAVSMAASPVLAVAVKKESSIRSVGLAFTAGASDVIIRSVRLSGVGNLDGSDAAADLADVITSCALFNGATQVGYSQAPDTTTGRMNITAVNVTVPAHTTLTLEARCTADSVVMGEYDLFSIGIADASDIVVERTDLFAVTPSVSDILRANAMSTTINYVTVMNRGVLTVAPDSFRRSTILVAGGDVWQNMAQFRLTSQYEGADIDEVRITSVGDAASFQQVAVAVDGVVLGWCILPAGTDRSCDAHLDTPLRVLRDGSRTFQLWAKISDVVSSSSVAGATTGVARSGAVLQLALAGAYTAGDWDPSYATAWNIRSTGLTSGDHLLVANPTSSVQWNGNFFEVRRSRPTFIRQSVSNVLVNGVDADLYRFRVDSNAGGSIALGGFRFIARITGTGTITSLGLRRNGFEVTDATIRTTVIAGETGISIALASEDIMSGLGNTYTLHGVTSGFASGDAVSITPFAPDPYYHHCEHGCYVGPDSSLDLGGPTLLPTALLWSDLSEVPHAFAPRALGGSLDWADDGMVDDLTQIQVLSR